MLRRIGDRHRWIDVRSRYRPKGADERHDCGARGRMPSHERAFLSQPDPQALRARTAGRSAGVGRRRALAGSVTTATVLPVMSKNSTEYPSSGTPGTTCRSTTVPTSPARSPPSVTSRVRITSPYMSKGMSYLGYMVMNLGTSVPVSTCQIEQNRTFLPAGVLIDPSTS